MPEENPLKEYVEAAAKGAAEEIGKKIPPLYPDLFQPATKQLGKALATVIGIVNIPLYPINWVLNRLDEKLADVSIENIVTPPINLLGPAFEQIKYLNDEVDLREMFAELLSKSMNIETKHKVHPSFVEIMRNLSSDDCGLLKNLWDKSSIIFLDFDVEQNAYAMPPTFWEDDQGSVQIGWGEIPYNFVNLKRLGLISETDRDKFTLTEADSECFRLLRTHFGDDIQAQIYKDIQATAEPSNIKVELYYMLLSDVGYRFCEACMPKKVK